MSTYKLLDWRGKLPGEPWSNIGSQKKTPGRKVIHYSGDDADIYRRMRRGEITLFDLIAWETRYQMTPGLYSPGFTVNGMMYHEVIWEDIVAVVRNADAKLWHCKDGTDPSSWNYSARSFHIPLTTGVRASQRTIRTLLERCDDYDRETGIGLAGRKLTLGHQEISSTGCPGTLMNDFVYPYRNGKLSPAPPEKSEAWDLGKYNFISGSEEWGDPRCKDAVEEINKRAGKKIARWTGQKDRAVYASQKAYESPDPAGKLVAIAVGEKAVEKLSDQAESVFGRFGKDDSDIWDGRYTGELWECIREIARRENLDGLPAWWNEKYEGSPKGSGAAPKPIPHGPKTEPVDLGPYAKDSVARIDRFFGTSYGQEIAEEADRAGLDLALACALVEQESNGRNIFGCDLGPRTSVPFCRQEVTRERVAELVRHIRAGGTSNGVGLTQITWRDFIYEAEALGGAHVPRNQLRVGFKLLAGYLGKYDYAGAVGAYNAGEGNRYSVRHTYTADVSAKHNAWRTRLGKAEAPTTGRKKKAPPVRSGSEFTGRANQLEQILQKEFGPLRTTTYGKHGYAASKPGYTEFMAIDIMVSELGVQAVGEQKKLGDRIAEFCVENFEAFGLGNVIWYERFNGGSGWGPYDWYPYYAAGYGSRNPVVHKHVDHVHIQCLKDGLIDTYEN